MSIDLGLLVITAASIGFVHTLLGPDHYVPFVAMSAARRWSRARTLWITGLCGLGHVLGSVAIGAVGIAIGVSLHELEWLEGFRGDVAAWLLTAFGLAYLAWGLKKAWRARPHTHEHLHADAAGVRGRVHLPGRDRGLVPESGGRDVHVDGADSFVREAAAAMENCSHDLFHRPILLRGLKGGYRQSAAVINAAGVKMRDNREGLTFVGGLAAENTENVKAVADAVAQLSETSNQIAREASEAARATQQTVAEAARASEAVGAMTEAVGAIDGMVALISKVAGQTHLLALNATIEAAAPAMPARASRWWPPR